MISVTRNFDDALVEGPIPRQQAVNAWSARGDEANPIDVTKVESPHHVAPPSGVTRHGLHWGKRSVELPLVEPFQTKFGVVVKLGDGVELVSPSQEAVDNAFSSGKNRT